MLRPALPAARAALLLSLPALLGTGCSLNEFVANGMGRMAEASAPDLAAHWDAELVLDGVPSGILQLEAMRSIAPGSRGLNLELARAYVAYGYGRIELSMEQHLAAGESREAARERARLQRVYLRAKDVVVTVVADDDPDIYAALDAGPEALERHLRAAYVEREDLEALYWMAQAWGGWVLAAEDPAMVTEEALMVLHMAERVVAVDPAYREGGALALLGRLSCHAAVGEAGGEERGREHFERALELTERRAHLVHVHYARSCLLEAGQRELYVELLREILEAPDQGNAVRMNNKIARARAEWYLPRTHVDLGS